MAGSNKNIIFPEPRWEKNSLKYCRECTEADKLNSITPYWRRSHNAPRVRICAQHKSYLFAITLRGPAYAPCQPGQLKPVSLKRPQAISEIKTHSDYAKACGEILAARTDHVPYELLRGRYFRIIEGEGLIKKNAVISELARRVAQTAAFTAFRADTTESPETWIQATLYPERLRQGRPFQHFALCEALQTDLIDMLSPREDTSFGMSSYGPKPPSGADAWRDDYLSKQIERLAKMCPPAAEKPKRRTRNWFTKQLGVHSDLERGRLPKTSQALAKHVETLRDYNLRWLKWVGWTAPLEEVEKLKDKGMIRNHLVRGRVRLDAKEVPLLNRTWEMLSRRRRSAVNLTSNKA